MSLVWQPSNARVPLRNNPALPLALLSLLSPEDNTGVTSFLAPALQRCLPSGVIMFKVKSFRRRILLALLGLGLVPTALLLFGGTLAIRWTVGAVGTAGPWGHLADSGQLLFQQIDSAGVDDPAIEEAATAHREALSESLRFSRMVSFLADRLLGFLPLLALGLALFIGALAFWVARQLSGGFSRPIQDLVGWTQLIGRGDPLPSPGPADTRGVQEFAQLRSALRDMAAELEEGRRQTIQATKLRSWTDMARKIAHELKNPLTPMRMAATSVSRLEGQVAQEAGVVLLDEIARLDEMARNFSQFGRMPEGPASDVDMTELLNMLVKQFEGSGPEIRFVVPSRLPWIRGHYDALLRCFRNLLLNAVDAAGPDGSIEVGAEQHDGFLRIEIRDTGPGIAEEFLDRIWEPDFSTKSRGTGLGLPMVRQTIVAHRGHVEGRNHPDGGAVFVVELPFAEPGSGL